MTDPARTVAIVLAAGAGSRFAGSRLNASRPAGSPSAGAKLLAELGGRPLLDHVLATAGSVGFGELIVVVPPAAPELERIAQGRGARVVVNPAPEAGLSSSVKVGLAGFLRREDAGENAGPHAALILLGDQPRTSRATIDALLAAEVPEDRSIVVPRYAGGGGANPVLLLRAAWPLAAALDGDRGFGPLIHARPELVVEVELPGDNPDVDTPTDLARIAEAGWAERVIANREQVDRIREVPDGDFYAPVRSLFRADPTRTDDPVLQALLAKVEPGDQWLDVGAGAGRFALPIARALAASGGSVVALDASPSMLEIPGRDRGRAPDRQRPDGQRALAARRPGCPPRTWPTSP